MSEKDWEWNYSEHQQRVKSVMRELRVLGES